MPTADSLGFVTTIGARSRRPAPSAPSAPSASPSVSSEPHNRKPMSKRIKIGVALGGIASMILAIVLVVILTGTPSKASASVATTAYFTSSVVVGQAYEVNRSELNMSFDGYQHTYQLEFQSLRLRQGFYDAPRSGVFVFDPDSIVGVDSVVSGFLVVAETTVPALFTHLERKQVQVHAHQAISPGLFQASPVVIAGASLPYRYADGQVAMPHHSDSGGATYSKCTLTAVHTLIYISAAEPMHRPFRYSSVSPFSLTFSQNFSWPLGQQWEDRNLAIVPIDGESVGRAAAIVRILNYSFTAEGGLSAWARSLNGVVPTTEAHKCSMLIDSTETKDTVQRFVHIVFELGRSVADLSVITEKCVGQIAIGAEKLCADNLASAIKSDLANAEALLAYLGVPSIDGTLQTILDEAIDIAAGAYVLLMGAIECLTELGFFIFPLPWPACVGELVMIGYEAYDVTKLIDTIEESNFGIPPTVYTRGKYRGRSGSAFSVYVDMVEPYSFEMQLLAPLPTDPDGAPVRDLLVCRDLGRDEIYVYDKGCITYQMYRRGVDYSEVASHSDYNCAFADCAHMVPIPIVFTPEEKILGRISLQDKIQTKVRTFLTTLSANDPWRAYHQCVHNITYASDDPKAKENGNIAFKSSDGSYRAYTIPNLGYFPSTGWTTTVYEYECMPVAVSAEASAKPVTWLQPGKQLTLFTLSRDYGLVYLKKESCSYGIACPVTAAECSTTACNLGDQILFTVEESVGEGCGILSNGAYQLGILGTASSNTQYNVELIDPLFTVDMVNSVVCFDFSIRYATYYIYVVFEDQNSEPLYLDLEHDSPLIASQSKSAKSGKRWYVAFPPSPPSPPLPPWAPAVAANVTCSGAEASKECTGVCCSMGSLQLATGSPFYSEAQKWCGEAQDLFGFCMNIPEGDYCGLGGSLLTGRAACGMGSYCENSICQKRKAENVACEENQGVINPSESMWQTKAMRPWRNECEEGLFCKQGVCVKKRGTGETCSLDLNCASGMCAYGGVTSVCCDNAECNTAGIGCGDGAGYCKNQKTGGACTDNGYCAPNHVCKFAAGAQQGTCSYFAPKAVGQPCDSNAECVHNMCAYGGTESVCCGNSQCNGWSCGDGSGYCANQAGGAPCTDDGYCAAQCNTTAGVCTT